MPVQLTPEFTLAVGSVVFGAGVAWGSMSLVGKRIAGLTRSVEAVEKHQQSSAETLARVETALVGVGDHDGLVNRVAILGERSHEQAAQVLRTVGRVDTLESIVLNVLKKGS